MDEQTLWRAVHMLHEQSHGPVPFVTCREDPCRELTRYTYGNWPRNDYPTGPAPLSLPYGRKDH